jgi:dihydroorotate dehydrogenase
VADVYGLIRPLLFWLPAEMAHDLAKQALGVPAVWRRLGSGPVTGPQLEVRVAGLTLANPIGLAPGFDKDCEVLGSLQHFGFGYLTGGSVLADRRPGNRKPRVARLVKDEAIVNAMGLPSKGIAHALRRLSELQDREIPIFVDVVGTTPDEILANVDMLASHVDALTVSLQCPNTSDTDPNTSLTVARRIAEHVAKCGKPVFVKIPLFVRANPDASLDEFLEICQRTRVTGVIVSGARHVRTSRLQLGHGQLAGRPVLQTTLDLVRRTHERVGSSLTIIASGGILSGRDAADALAAGATLIQIYSALVFRGWAAPALIARELAEILAEREAGQPAVGAVGGAA